MSKLIVGNWKMNGSLNLIDEFVSGVDDRVVLGLPAVFISYAHSRNPKLKIAAQDCSIFSGTGAHTGEVSADLLVASGCSYVIIGHSERRKTSDLDSIQNVLRKLQNAVSAGMTAIICVDEDYSDLLDEKTVSFIKNRTDAVVLAYEPLSAIGTGVVPSVSEISRVLQTLKDKYFGIRTLYGGSVNSKNSKEILSADFVDGVLVGGASLKLQEINDIAQG